MRAFEPPNVDGRPERSHASMEEEEEGDEGATEDWGEGGASCLAEDPRPPRGRSGDDGGENDMLARSGLHDKRKWHARNGSVFRFSKTGAFRYATRSAEFVKFYFYFERIRKLKALNS